jgi:hypothetical protein
VYNVDQKLSILRRRWIIHSKGSAVRSSDLSREHCRLAKNSNPTLAKLQHRTLQHSRGKKCRRELRELPRHLGHQEDNVTSQGHQGVSFAPQSKRLPCKGHGCNLPVVDEAISADVYSPRNSPLTNTSQVVVVSGFLLPEDPVIRSLPATLFQLNRIWEC